MVDEQEKARARRAQAMAQASNKTPDPVTAAQNTLASLEALQKQLEADIAASKKTSQEKSVEIPTIALEQAVATGDKNAAVTAAKAVAKAQGGDANAQAANAIDAIQAATPKPVLNQANIDRGDQIKWVGGVNGSWQIIKGTNVVSTTSTSSGDKGFWVHDAAKDTTNPDGSVNWNEYWSTDPSKTRVTKVTPQKFGSSSSVSANTNLTQVDVDAAVNKALAAQAAQFKAQQDAEKMLTRTRAKDKLTAMLAGWNLTGLADWLDKQIMADVSEEMIFLGLYDQPEYQKRFPGMEALRKAGRTITEGEYIKIENQMMQTARFFDLPVGFYDGPEDFGALIGKQVSAKEYQDRLQIGQDLARTLNAEVKQQLIDFYGVGEGDLTAYVLDADRALPLIQKQAKAAQFVGLGRAAGFSLQGITSQQAEAIAGTEPYAKLSEAQLKQSLGQAGYLRRTQQRLSQIEGMTYNEQEALSAVIESSPEALLASQQRAQREVARFSARGGVTAGSLRDITAI